MKRFAGLLCIMLAVSLCVGAQENSAKSQYYAVYADTGAADADMLAKKLDKLFALFNGYFRFDTARLKAPLTVRMFSSKEAFNEHLKKVIGETKDDFVYLQYPTAERSELLIFGKDNADDFNASLAHQAFVQFIKAFISEPPLWLREGFAVFFERSYVDSSSGKIVYNENLAWLETVKQLKTQSKLYQLTDLMTVSANAVKAKLDVFYPQSWMFVSFLINNPNKSYNRFIWDTVPLLARDAGLDQNQAAVKNFYTTWYDTAAAEADFKAYIDAQKTFGELITLGVRAYNEKKYDEAHSLFSDAHVKNAAHYIPPYYLGLIAYARGDYDTAKNLYTKALELGCDAPISNYALGINAYEAKRYEEAALYLNKAIEGDPARYKTKAGDLLTKIEAEKK